MTFSDGKATEFLIDLFAEYDRQGVRYCLLRNYETLPDRLESRDVDILIDVSSKQKNREIITRLVKKYMAVIYNHYVDERFDQFYLFRRNLSHSLFELKIDFFFDSEIYGICILPGEDILRSRCAYRNIFVAHDIYKVLDKWLFNFLLGAKLPEKYHSEFKRVFIDHRVSMTILLAKIFGSPFGEQLVSHICSTGLADLPRIRKGQFLLVLLRLACKNPRYHLWHVPLFFWYRLKHTITPKGEFISVSGPDGCGKTTLIELAKEQLEKLFDSVPDNNGHFRPNVLPSIAQVAKRVGAISEVDENYALPHRGMPSGLVVSLLRFSYYLLDYLWGYFVKIRPVLVRRELVLYDRYYFDMVADPGRSRISLPGWVRNAALSIVPAPHTAFFIHTPSDVVRERKQELPVEEVEELNAAYLEMAETSRLQIVENSDTAEAAAAKLADMVIERRRRRLGLDRHAPKSIREPLLINPESHTKVSNERKVVFFRNDDVGLFSSEPVSSALINLTQVFVEENIPISHSVVPAAVNNETVKWLLDMKSKHPHLIGIDQHGYAHIKHEASEFGGKRSYAEQKQDIGAGLVLMDRYFDSAFSHCFSVPKIRYNVHTKRICDELGFKVFSGGVSPRIHAQVFNMLGRAMNLNVLGSKEVSYHRRADFTQRGFNVLEISVSVDVVQDYRTKMVKTIDTIVNRYNQCEKYFDVIGIMLHHWVFDSEYKISIVRELFKALRGNPFVTFKLLEQVFDEYY